MVETCAARPAVSVRLRTISVNGVVIPREAIARETQHHPATTPLEAWRAATRALVLRELLLQEAERRAIDATPLRDEDGRRETAEEARIRALLERAVPPSGVDDATCRAFYDGNPGKMRSPDLHEVSHILLAAVRPADRDGAKALAAELLDALGTEPHAFVRLALVHSACPSGKVGGSLGQIGPGQTVEEFEAALRMLTVGAIHPEPVETRYGYHIVRLDRRIEGRLLPYGAVKASIASFLAARSRKAAEYRFVESLARDAAVVGVDMPGWPATIG